MSYLVMECRRSYAVLLDQEGRFVKAANLRYEVGQTVFDPVLLEEPAPKLKLLPWIGGGAAGLAALAAALVFAVILPLYHQAVDVYSSIYLTINPQVQMDLNHAGDVVEPHRHQRGRRPAAGGLRPHRQGPPDRGGRTGGPGH